MLNIFITSCINAFSLILILKYNLSSFFLSIHHCHMSKFHRFNKNAYQISNTYQVFIIKQYFSKKFQKMITQDTNTSLAKCEIQEKGAQCLSENCLNFKKRSSDNLFIQTYQSRKPFFFTLLGVNKELYKLMTTLKSHSHLPKEFELLQSISKTFKNDEKYFLFHLSSQLFHDGGRCLQKPVH